MKFKNSYFYMEMKVQVLVKSVDLVQMIKKMIKLNKKNQNQIN